MKLSASIKVALRALRVNRLRSALTMLGMIIGVGAVIAMMAVGSGATSRIQEQIASIGSNMIIVMPGSARSGPVRLGAGGNVSLTEADAAAIAAETSVVRAAAPAVMGRALVINGNLNWYTSLRGSTPAYLAVRDQQVDLGRMFTDAEVRSAAKVALLGPTVSNMLFPGTNPVGQYVRIKSVPFTVIGVLSPKGQSAGGQDQDDAILMPITTAKRRVMGASQANLDSVGSILVSAAGGDRVKAAQDRITSLLRQRHRIGLGQDDDFMVQDMSEIFSAQESSAEVMSILLAAIASVSLVVGGIGIMNTMLVSVTERTREIGLRQSVGAKTKDILTQFLVEAVAISAIGGILGIVVGVTASEAISHFAKWSTVISSSSILLAVLFSGLVGVVFGYYPARKAAYLDPIDALRYE